MPNEAMADAAGLPGAPARAAGTGEEAAEFSLTFDDNRRAGILFGHYDQNLAHIERRLGILLNALGNRVVVKGPVEVASRARRVLDSLYERTRNAGAISLGDVDGAIQESVLQGSLFPQAEPAPASARPQFEQIATRRRGPVRARNAAQDVYLKALRAHELVFAEGPAGTGKTWLAVGYAVSLLEAGQAERLILSRPAVEAGERLGFLPGDMREKVDPYLRPIYDALYDFMEARHVERALQTGMIEVAPLAFMRGRTLANAVVLLDEAQNTTSMQMKMFLTRLGEGSRMIVNGDPSQIDLPHGQRSGLVEAVRILEGVEGVARITFPRRRRGSPRSRAPHRDGLRRRHADRDATVMELDLRVEAGDWGDVEGLEALLRSAAEAAIATVPDAPSGPVCVTLLLADDRAVRELNRAWRGQDKPTNVLSFPAGAPPMPGAPIELGDLTLAFETVRGEAAEENKSLAEHAAHLVVHGILHLLGFDHLDDVAADRMERLEVAVLKELGIADPYAASGSVADAKVCAP